MERLAEKKDCTACMNCLNTCLNGAISVKRDSLDNIYPSIDQDKCVDCKQCAAVCPAINPVNLSEPKKCFAAYSTNENIRHFSASGGWQPHYITFV